MTDREKWKAFLDSFNIPYTEKTYEEDNSQPYILLEAKTNDKIEGYNGFVCVIEFNNDSSFRCLGIWD